MQEAAETRLLALVVQVKSPQEQLHVAVVGGGLGGLITAMDLADAGHKVGEGGQADREGGKQGG